MRRVLAITVLGLSMSSIACRGGQAPPSPIRVLPETIYSSAGTWTFVLLGTEPDRVTAVSLILGEEDYSPVTRRIVPPHSVIYDFECPLIPEDVAAAVRVRIGSTEQLFPLAVTRPEVPNQRDVQPGVVHVRLGAGTFGWTASGEPAPDHLYRPIDAVPCHDSLLAVLLRAIEAHTISKMHAYASDGDSFWVAGTGKVVMIPPAGRSSYGIVFPKSHSVYAVQEMLLHLPAVLSASWTGVAIPD